MPKDKEGKLLFFPSREDIIKEHPPKDHIKNSDLTVSALIEKERMLIDLNILSPETLLYEGIKHFENGSYIIAKNLLLQSKAKGMLEANFYLLLLKFKNPRVAKEKAEYMLLLYDLLTTFRLVMVARNYSPEDQKENTFLQQAIQLINEILSFGIQNNFFEDKKSYYKPTGYLKDIIDHILSEKNPSKQSIILLQNTINNLIG